MDPSLILPPEAGRILERLGDKHGLSAGQIERLGRILRALAASEHAPTSIRDPQRAVDLHLADTLVALELDLVRKAGQIADIGAGAGFPGLPLAIALPNAKVKLIESQVRKCAFMESVCTHARIDNASVICERVEEWQEGICAHDLVLARAVASQPIVLEYAAPILRMWGVLLDWRGRRDPSEERAASLAAELLGLRLDEVRKVKPYEGVRDHHLHVYVKVRETPSKFPRRAGMARKKPLAL